MFTGTKTPWTMSEWQFSQPFIALRQTHVGRYEASLSSLCED